MKLPIVCLFLLSSLNVVIADEQVRATQEELRRRNIYFGDVDGRQSDELQEALKRYQKRKGLAATGREDRDTLRSLGLVRRDPDESPPKELQWPSEPVLKSDARLDVATAAQEIAATTGVAPASVAAGGAPRTSRAVPASARAPASQGLAPRTGIGSRPAVRFSPNNKELLGGQIIRYVKDYVKAIGRNRLDEELPFYADRVNYLGNGWIDRRIIEHSLAKYYQRWPKRSYSPVGPISYRSVPGRGEIVVNFQTSFSLANGSGRVRGLTENQMVINAATADPRIVSFTERRVRQ